jgi:hypothetical protein
MKTFAELYCDRHAKAAEHFERAVLRRCLHLPARPLVPALRVIHPDFFAPDLELIRSVGRLRRDSDFSLEVQGFRDHPGNQHWLRRHLRLRISTRRLRRLLRDTLAGAPSRSASGGSGTVR